MSFSRTEMNCAHFCFPPFARMKNGIWSLRLLTWRNAKSVIPTSMRQKCCSVTIAKRATTREFKCSLVFLQALLWVAIVSSCVFQSRCLTVFHVCYSLLRFCLDPPLTTIPRGDWFCEKCKERAAPLAIAADKKGAQTHYTAKPKGSRWL